MTTFRSRTQYSYFVNNALQVYDLQGFFIVCIIFQNQDIELVLQQAEALSQESV